MKLGSLCTLVSISDETGSLYMFDRMAECMLNCKLVPKCVHLLLSRYVQYYTDLLRQPDLLPRRLQLRKVVVTGVPMSDLSDLVIGVWVRPPGAGWKTELLCLAAARPAARHLQGVTCCPDVFQAPSSYIILSL